MSDISVTNSGDYMPWLQDFPDFFTEPRSHDQISTTDAASFTLDSSESEAQLDHNSEQFSQWYQLSGDEIDFSSSVTTDYRMDQLQILDQQSHDKIIPDRHIPQHEPIVIFPNTSAGSAESLSSNQYALPGEEPKDQCSHAVDSAQTQRLAWKASLPESSAPNASWALTSIESKTPRQHNVKRAVMFKKRHPDIEDVEFFPPGLVNLKRQKTAAYDFPNRDQVGTIEASFFEDWLSKFPDVYPGPEQFVLLAGLTQLRAETVQLWFNERLRNGSRCIPFATLSAKPSSATEAPNSDIPQISYIQQPADQASEQPPDLTLERMKLEASNWVREHKAKKCRKKRNPKNFVRDPEKPYCCTLGCGAKFKDKDDWRKHEESNYPQGGWVCNMGSIAQFDGRILCAFCGMLNPKTEHDHGKVLCSEKKVKARGRLHFRKQHFSQHFIRVHPGIPSDQYLENNHFTVKSKFPRRCGFCRYLSKHWRDRIEHIGGHFIAGQDMSQWDFGVEDNELDQTKSTDNENPDRDGGGFNGKRHKDPRDESGPSDDDCNSSPPNPAPKQRRQNTQHTYARQICSLMQSRDLNLVKDFGRTTHIHQESHSVLLNESSSDIDSPNLESENISYTPSSITATIIYSAPSKKLTRPVVTKAVTKSTRLHLSDKHRLFTIMDEVKAIERSRHHCVPYFLRTFENSAYFHLRTNFSTRNDLAGLIRSYTGNLMPSVEAIARWSTDVPSLASLRLDIWSLLNDDDNSTFKNPLESLLAGGALCHEYFAQFDEWVSLLKKNWPYRRTMVAQKALNSSDTMLTVQQKDTSIAYITPSQLYSGISRHPIEKTSVPLVENTYNASPISDDNTSEASTTPRADLQLVSGKQGTSETSRHPALVSQDDLPMPTINTITPNDCDAAAASDRKALLGENFRKEIEGRSLFSISDDILSSLEEEVRAPLTGVQSEFCDIGTGSDLDLNWMVHDSFLETNFEYNYSSDAISSYSTSNFNYALQHEPNAGIPLADTWSQSTAPWGLTFTMPTLAIDSTSTTFLNFVGYDLSGASEIQGPWSSIPEDLGSIMPPFLNTDLIWDSANQSCTSAGSNRCQSSKSRDYSSHNQTKGRRTGKLSLESRMNAVLMRNIRVCWQCRVRKIRCNADAICRPCVGANSPFKGRLCVRARIGDHIPYFLPDTITSKYSETAVQVALCRQIESFTNNQIEIRISVGSNYPTMLLTVNEFIPLHRQSSQLTHASLIELDDVPEQNAYLHVLPLALLHYDPIEVKHKLIRHIKAVIETLPDKGETIDGETWIVSWKTFEAVNKYRRASDICEKDRILELAFELHTMYHIMSRVITIEPSSALQSLTKLQRPYVLPYYERIFGSNIIDLQLKCEMISPLRETTAQVLHGLEFILECTPGKHATWSTAFCLLLLVCSCIEAVEIAIDATIIVRMQKVDRTTADMLRLEQYQELEQRVFCHVEGLFMYVYKSHRIQGKGGFNPIRDGLKLNEEKGITLPMVELVKDMRNIIKEHEDDINDRAKDPEFEAELVDPLENHMRFRKRNSGRLLSKFLKGFSLKRSESTKIGATAATGASD